MVDHLEKHRQPTERVDREQAGAHLGVRAGEWRSGGPNGLGGGPW
ncbi:hypothetical protein ACMHYB_29370 [Sorangium sp. So ce1128]